MRSALIIVILLSGPWLYSQTSKNHIKAAEQYILNGYYEDAVEEYSRALALEPQNGKIYEERAKALLNLNKVHEAASDFKTAAFSGVNAPDNFLAAARLVYSLKEYNDASLLAGKAVQSKTKFYEAYILQTQIYLALNNYALAREAAINASDAKSTAYALYLKGFSETELGNLQIAEQDLEKAIIKDKLLSEAYIKLSEVQLKNNKPDYALENCSYVLSFDRNNLEALILRSRIFAARGNYSRAITDITKALSVDSLNSSLYLARGKYYLESSQENHAIDDFSSALKLDMLNTQALILRAQAYEKTGAKELATSDLSLLLTLTDQDEISDVAWIEKKIYEINRESVKPKIVLLSPGLNDNQVALISRDQGTTQIKLRIEDASNLHFLRINNDTLLDNRAGSRKKEFELIMKSDIEFLTITASDIYNNTTTESYNIEHIETHAPNIFVYNPYVGDDGIITLNIDDRYLYIEGRIEDESLIKSIFVDEVTASFAPATNNPRFTASLDVSAKTNLQIRVIDQFGNSSLKEYSLKRTGGNPDNESPMGKTWVVLIENSEYKEFINLSSPEKDIQIMQQALMRYKINKVIVKKNMTKKEMERFFSIDLRDLIRINNVNSLFIWFAGHGKNIEGTGYWIPSDARIDVEFSYFSINALKASLYSYTSLTHLLIVSDACETGPGFSTAMRGPIENITCSNLHLMNKKSAQVLTSAGSGYAYDNSLFTRAFANALLNNEDDCSTIDAIEKRVRSIMLNSSNQKTEFGRISGIEDDAGTFVFISR